MNKCQIDIKGMHCRSCELLLCDEIIKVPGVEEVSVYQNSGTAKIKYDGELKFHAVKKAIEDAGYELGKEERPIISRNLGDYRELGIAFFIVIALYSIAKNFGVFDLSKNISGAYSSLGVVFLVGLTAGISTCMALVGGLILGAAARFSENHPTATGIEKFKPHLIFNLGRIVSYFILGGVIGYAGSFFSLSSSTLGLMTIIVGLVMLLLGGQLIDIFPILKRFSFTLPTFLTDFLGIQDRSDQEYSHKNSFVMGAMTFFLPCGFTQAMQLFAIKSGSPVVGAMTMGIFALGTAPGLLGVGGLTSIVKKESSRLFFKTAGVIVVLLAFFNLSNGLNLLGISPKVLGAFTTKTALAKSGTDDPNVKLVKGIQEVRMRQTSRGYSPNSFTIQKGIPVRWIIISEDQYSCASSIVSQKLGVRKSLQLGENIIEFTPDKTGSIPFSCSMGMYTGSFTVVDGSDANSTNVLGATNQRAAQTNAPSTAGACCSGGCGCGGGAKTPQPVVSGIVEKKGQAQLIKASYTRDKDIVPNQFTVKVNQPVRFEIAVNEDGQGCMGSITLPGLTNQVYGLTKGQPIIFEFTPTTIGAYNITCAMGVPRGIIQVI